MGKCTCTNHDRHLCKLYESGLHKQDPQKFAHLIRDPQFVCKSCGRVANCRENLCEPVLLGTWED